MSDYSYIDTIESSHFVINRLLKDRRLSEWEKGFIKSLKDYTDTGGFLSEKQKQKLSDIWEKY